MGVGRPRIYNDVEELSRACEQYFTNCLTTALRPTVTGLALWLGFADKTTLYEYRDRQEFSYSIKTSLTMIENALEQKLENNSVAGIIFALKNMGWKDKQELDVRTPEGVMVNYNLQKGNDPLPDVNS